MYIGVFCVDIGCDLLQIVRIVIKAVLEIFAGGIAANSLAADSSKESILESEALLKIVLTSSTVNLSVGWDLL